MKGILELKQDVVIISILLNINICPGIHIFWFVFPALFAVQLFYMIIFKVTIRNIPIPFIPCIKTVSIIKS